MEGRQVPHRPAQDQARGLILRPPPISTKARDPQGMRAFFPCASQPAPLHDPMNAEDGIRLNKFLASCGAGSRRQCDELIRQGRVELNGSPVTQLATRVGPDDHVRLDGKRLQATRHRVVAFHKPAGLVCSREDELGRDTIYRALPGAMRKLHHVGRLDLESEGLLILTNDGDLSQQLLHPSRAIEKEYLVTINQALEAPHLTQLREGIHTPEGRLRAKEVERISARRLKIILEQGAKRQIRVMLLALGYRVQRLLRVRIGGLWLGELEPGQWADLTPPEVQRMLEGPEPESAAKHQKRRK